MINWEEFEQLHVVRKLREILGQWWGIEVFFADDRGNLKNISPEQNKNLFNPICQLLLSSEKGVESLSQFSRRSTNELRKSASDHVLSLWDIGLMGATVPIDISQEFIGTVQAVGFLSEKDPQGQKKKIYDNLKPMGFASEDIESALGQLHVITEGEKNYFLELVNLVSQEIIGIHNEISSREEKIQELNKELGVRYRYNAMIGKSKPMQDLYNLLDKIKASEATVLIQGENGTGKELIARAIHYSSSRKDKIIVTQNCSAFNENLLDSELFGHVKGSFTGAIRDKKGLFEVSDGGSFFLDEVGDMSAAMQVKLLRVLQEGTFLPVGGTEPRKVNVRVIAATNRDLKEMVDRGLFREDLYYRMNVINITVPPLRERKEDIPLLIEHFLEKAAKDQGGKKKVLAKRAIEKLLDFNWPGNVRELENEIERLVVLSGTETKVNVDILSARVRSFGEKGKIQGVRVQGKLKDALEELEREMIKEGLKRTDWNKSKLAKELGISRAGLIMKVEKYGLDKRKMLKK